MNITGMPPDQVARELAAKVPVSDTRQLIAIAGPPASGKSTLAQALVSELCRAGRPTGLLAMDGFHLDNAVLDARGLRARKGAAETFDLAGFASILRRLRTESVLFVPTFDRARDVSIGASAEITEDQKVVVVEGNYLLLDAPGWKDLARHWDMTIFVDVPEPVLVARLQQRWLDHGYDATGARAKLQCNDLPNARRVRAERVAHVDMTLTY